MSPADVPEQDAVQTLQRSQLPTLRLAEPERLVWTAPLPTRSQQRFADCEPRPPMHGCEQVLVHIDDVPLPCRVAPTTLA
eukprot:8832071-Prorocentrum_lima.AAC.1